jgi:hypothetical protein
VRKTSLQRKADAGKPGILAALPDLRPVVIDLGVGVPGVPRRQGKGPPPILTRNAAAVQFQATKTAVLSFLSHPHLHSMIKKISTFDPYPILRYNYVHEGEQ